ncbi:MAG: hypothetical protein KGQ41_06170 [Alphaproteobacteria bacterium]|nr:hypothetical protein [Alphaproteobacteria bacterium]
MQDNSLQATDPKPFGIVLPLLALLGIGLLMGVIQTHISSDAVIQFFIGDILGE